jgi:hypothetical protein
MDFTPKANFAKGPSAQPWTEVASSALFVEAAGVAMLQMQSNLGMATRSDQAAAFQYKMEGARIFLAILMKLTDPPEQAPPRTKSANLNHAV